jgi:ectoine hydroxylase-related dioxygenase (phytanoyl-CoA dioxygenase family)
LTLERDGIQFQHNNILSEPQVDEFVGVLQNAIHETEALIRQHRPSITLGESTFAFSEICARGPLRFDLQLKQHDATQALVRNYILSQPVIQEQLQTWLHCNSMDEIDFDVSVVYSKPGAEHQAWHTDGHYFHDKVGTYAVCLFVPCLDLSHETGYTQFWPGSHHSEKWMGLGKVAELTESTVDGICCRKGEGIWYHYQTWHRGMANTTLETTRLVLQIVFKQSWYVERDNYGTESIVPKQTKTSDIDV